MPKKLKKNLSRLFKNKKAIFAFLFFVILGVFFFSHLISAQRFTPEGAGQIPEDSGFWDYLWEDYKYYLGQDTGTVKQSVGLGDWNISEMFLNMGKNLIYGIPAALFYVVAQIASFFADLAAATLRWILSPGFMNISYTNPNNNPIIKSGLGITQSFVNMILVLVLVYIAIATILRLAGYETRKILITFIIVALLVNFAPVICGLIVDASNIAMKFFTQNQTISEKTTGEIAYGTSFTARSKTVFNKMTTTHEGLNPLNKEQRADLLINTTQLFVMTIVYFLAGLIYLIFALVFAVRYMAIWVLVILSPIAFDFYILPNTRKFFLMWWQQFIQWCFIGVTCGFFLYLAELFSTLVDPKSGDASKIALSIPDPSKLTLGATILPLFIPVVFLGIGLIYGLQTSAIGASAIIGFRIPQRSLKWVGKRVWQRGAKPALEQGIGIFRPKDWAKTISQTWEKAPIARWFLPEPIRKYSQYRGNIDEGAKAFEPYASKDIAKRLASGAETGTNFVGGMMKLLERGDFQDFMTDFKKKYGAESDRELFDNKKFLKDMDRYFEITLQGGYHSKMLRSDPRIARAWTGKEWFKPYKDFTPDQAVERAASETRRQHINVWEREVTEDSTIVESLMARGREPFEAIDIQLKRGVETTQKTIDILFSEYVDKVLKKKNAALAEAVKRGEENASKEGWEEYRKYFKTQHKDKEGFFTALKSERFTDRGYRKGTYLTPVKRAEEIKGEAPPETPSEAPVSPPVPGAAVGIKPKKLPLGWRRGKGKKVRGRPGPGVGPSKKPKGRPGLGV